SHPNIVQIYDYGRATDGPFLIMECVRGGSLLEKCKAGPIELDEAVNIFGQLCDGLSKAHAAGIIHRDIKPLRFTHRFKHAATHYSIPCLFTQLLLGKHFNRLNIAINRDDPSPRILRIYKSL
ncbi:MAG: protein kinase, partial [Planctomycetaceae bacterium]|nr:protein kinase [Planctomycetaceae bacterium]